jgi:hypothetical protein
MKPRSAGHLYVGGFMESDDFFAKLDAANSESDVRAKIASDQYPRLHVNLAQEWLRRREEDRSSAAAARSEAREERMLLIASATSDSARLAQRWAMWAAIIAITAITIATQERIVEMVISWLP